LKGREKVKTFNLPYEVKLSRDEDGRYLVRFPDIPEALTDGATREEALAEAADALAEALAGRINRGDNIPKPDAPGEVEELINGVEKFTKTLF
jgi:antitoxin HicB